MHRQPVKRKPDGGPTIIGTISVLGVEFGSRVNGGLTLTAMFADGAVIILF